MILNIFLIVSLDSKTKQVEKDITNNAWFEKHEGLSLNCHYTLERPTHNTFTEIITIPKMRLILFSLVFSFTPKTLLISVCSKLCTTNHKQK
jgi:hypothetical protein